MTLIKYILKNDNIDFKYLFKYLRKNLLTIIAITLTLFIISSLFSYKNLSQQVNFKINVEIQRDINILTEKYRKAMSTNDKLKKFMKDFVLDLYKSYYLNLSKNDGNNFKFTENSYNKKQNSFLFKLKLNSWKIPTNQQLDLIKKEFISTFFETLFTESNKYSSAIDIDYKILNKSIDIRKIEILNFNRISFILLLISTFFTSLIISILFILFTKKK